MLLPSALSCESRQYSTRSRFASTRLFPSTPPPSDDSFVAGNGLLGTCRALQSLLNSSPAQSPRRAKPGGLQSPLHIVRPQPQPHHNYATRTPKRVVKPAAKPARGLHKRRREAYEDQSDVEMMTATPTSHDKYSTPKRPRRAPFELPLGLESSDFRSLDSPYEPESHFQPQSPSTAQSQPSATPATLPWNFHGDNPNTDRDTNLNMNLNLDVATTFQFDSHNLRNQIHPFSSHSDPISSPSDWTSDDDKRLVEMVLDKLKLSKRDWNDCARRMGKDHDSVGKRWKALVGEGNVGLRRGRRMVRGRIDESWRQR